MYLQVEQTFGAKPLTSLTPHLLNQYRECLEACVEEADLEDYFSRGIGVSMVTLAVDCRLAASALQAEAWRDGACKLP